MVAICDPAKVVKARGQRKQVQRLGSGSSEQERSIQKRKQKRAAIEAEVIFGETEKLGRAQRGSPSR